MNSWTRFRCPILRGKTSALKFLHFHFELLNGALYKGKASLLPLGLESEFEYSSLQSTCSTGLLTFYPGTEWLLCLNNSRYLLPLALGPGVQLLLGLSHNGICPSLLELMQVIRQSGRRIEPTRIEGCGQRRNHS